MTGLSGMAYLIQSAAGKLGLKPDESKPGDHSGHNHGNPPVTSNSMVHTGFDMPGVVGEVDHELNGFNPADILTDFDPGQVSVLPNGQTLHEYEFAAIDKDIELAANLMFPAWTYNGRVPGPTIRVREGDRVRVKFINTTDHPAYHSLSWHSPG